VYDQSVLKPAPATALEFDDVYGGHFHDVVRWARALGGPDADLDDLAQEVFLVVERRLHEFDGRNLGGWLYRITALVVSAHRRRAWFRHVFMRPRDVELDGFTAQTGDPGSALEHKERQRLLYRVLGRMSAKRREAFALFEIEQMSGEEIAQLVGVPVATVWTRLHHARKDFLELVRELGEE
jgi:RNA polymerase sigma-70 factor (ECF subfamily)